MNFFCKGMAIIIVHKILEDMKTKAEGKDRIRN